MLCTCTYLAFNSGIYAAFCNILTDCRKNIAPGCDAEANRRQPLSVLRRTSTSAPHDFCLSSSSSCPQIELSWLVISLSFSIIHSFCCLCIAMAFLGGAECSTVGNPLTQFTKHVQDDKSLQRDRLTGRGPGGQYETFRSQGTVGQHDMVSLYQSSRGLAA